MVGAGRLSKDDGSLAARVLACLPDGPVVIALSGGADSAACAWAIVTAGREVRAVTVDHGLAASGDLVRAAGTIAAAFRIEHMVVSADTNGESEDQLRDARYAALAAATRRGEIVVTAHTADDQAETVLGNLLRGAGAAGLSGIPSRRGRWVRPMLGVTRAEARATARRMGLAFVDDPQNTDPAVRRSALRTQVIPLLERFNPSLRAGLRRTADFAAADDRALEERASLVPLRSAPGEVRVAASCLTTVPRAVASRAVRRAMRTLLDPYAGSAADISAVLDVAFGRACRVALSESLLAAREGPWVAIHGVTEVLPSAPVPLVVPGSVKWGGHVITAAAEPDPVPRPLGRFTALIRSDIGPLTVRAWRAGDRVALADGSKKVAEALREAGIPARSRAGWPVVMAGGRIAWPIGASVAHDVRPQRDRPVVVLSVRRGQ